MKCPICSAPLEPEYYEGIEIDVCDQDGTWLDTGELPKIIELREARFPKELTDEVLVAAGTLTPDEEHAREMNCPKCGASMLPVNYQYSSGIIINRCRNGHGLWLDRSELQRIEAFMEAWEAKAEEGKERYASMLEEVRREQEARRKEYETHSGPSSFNVINSLLRRIIELT